jgi:hypothetical protein
MDKIHRLHVFFYVQKPYKFQEKLIKNRKNLSNLNTKKTDQLSFLYTANPHVLVLFTKFRHASL